MPPGSPLRHNKPPKIKVDGQQKPAQIPITPKTPDASAANYDEAQTEEIEVLQAIYMDDYEEVIIKSAWSKTNERAFKLKLKSFSDEDVYIVLSVKLTATYPRSIPILETSGIDGLHDRTQARIQRLITQRPKELLGEVMIHAIASEIQDALEDAVQARAHGVVPSLEEERAINKAALQAQEDLDQEAEAKRQIESKEEEERALQEMVKQELQRREAKQSRPTDNADAEVSADIVRLDETVEILHADDVIAFDSVRVLEELPTGHYGWTCTVQPAKVKGCLLSMQRFSLRSNVAPTFRSDLLALENELKLVKSLTHPHILRLYTFKLDKIVEPLKPDNDSWVLLTLLDTANRGTIEELMEDHQSISVEKAKQWSLDLLDALEYLHRHGLVHKGITCSNILLDRSPSGVVTPLFANVGYANLVDKLRPEMHSRSLATPEPWRAPEYRLSDKPYTRKSDIWDFGTVLVRLFLGGDALAQYSSPSDLMSSNGLSDPLLDLVEKMFAKDARHRPSAFELLPSEFFRSSAPVFDKSYHEKQPTSAQPPLSLSAKKHSSRASRHSSNGALEAPAFSRYAHDFTELHRLGRGGFGEVVKVRNKIDGGLYAVKKIKSESRSQLEQVLSEVMLLHRLNHPYVVRYYSAWVEDEAHGAVSTSTSDVSTSQADVTSSSSLSHPQFGLSSRGLDFVSSSGYRNIRFEDDDDSTDGGESSDDNETDGIVFGVSSSDAAAETNIDIERVGEEAIEDVEVDEAHKLLPKARSSSSRLTRSTLYIQMELCEKKTLRDLIVRGLPAKIDEGWQMLRQILEGLVHIHGHGIIHRDLKPDNIFIDSIGNPRIGDFGLATTNRTSGPSRLLSSQHTGGDMTRSVGTALYVAPEIQSHANLSYNDKVDMYSLGIIFFEMCYPLPTAMERVKTLRQIRMKNAQLPDAFSEADKAVQGSIINSLISHTPGERPSSVELLRSGKIPLQIEDEAIRTALLGLGDSSSPYHQKILSMLFAQSNEQRVKDFAWYASDDRSTMPTCDELQIRRNARSVAESVFQRHGAVEVKRPVLFPRSPVYNTPTVVQLLDQSGNQLQLSFDLTLPYARQLAKHAGHIKRSYTFGEVYRDAGTGGPPRTHAELDFDIVSNCVDTTMHDAEVIKVVDELLDEMPALASANICFHLNHSSLLNIILEFCGIDQTERPAVKESLSKLNFHQWTWSKIRSELRSPIIGISSTALDALSQFDFRETLDKAAKRLEALFEKATQLPKLKLHLESLRQILKTLQGLGVRRVCYICPLASHNEKFYEGAFLFQAIHDKRNRSVLAAGGRYDSLVRAHQSLASASPYLGAVGVNIGWDGLVSASLRHGRGLKEPTSTKKNLEAAVDPAWGARRCDVLVTWTDPATINTACTKILSTLWSHGISTELAVDSDETDAILSRRRASDHTFIITVRADPINSVRIRNLANDTDAEVAVLDLPAHIRSELRERDRNEMQAQQQSHQLRRTRGNAPSLLRHGTNDDKAAGGEVTVLMAQHRSKKSNKYAIVSAAHSQWAAHLESLKNAPIVAVETRDDVLDALRETRLGDADSWRKVVQAQGVNERAYLGQVQALLEERRARWREAGDGEGEHGREVALFNFRTGKVVYYDLGL